MAINTKDYHPTKHTSVKIHTDKVRYLLDIVIEGKRYRRVFKSNMNHTAKDRLKTAYEACERFKEEILHKMSISADTEATVDDYWERVKAVKGWKERLSKKYDYYYSKHLVKFAKKKIRDIKPSSFTTLNAELKNKGLAPRTQLEAYEILKPIFELAVEDEIISVSPIKKSHIPKRKQLEEKKIVTEAEEKYRKVYKAINTLFKDNPHHRAAFLFGFHGRRLQETLNLEWSDIDLKNKLYIVRGQHSKVNTDMEFTLPDDIASALYEFRDTSGKIFTVKSLDCHHQKIRDYTGIQEFSFHWMRNLSVSALSAMGVEITHLSAMLGHTDGSTIRKYLSLQREASTAVTNKASQRLLS